MIRPRTRATARSRVLLLLLLALLTTPIARATPIPIPDYKNTLLVPTLVKENRALKAKNRKLEKSLKYHARWVRRLKSYRRPQFLAEVYYAMKLARVIYGVPVAAQRAVGRCESGLDPTAQNGQYRGVFQEGPMFEAGPFGRAGFSVFDPLANVFTAAYTVANQGWRQWQCQP